MGLLIPYSVGATLSMGLFIVWIITVGTALFVTIYYVTATRWWWVVPLLTSPLSAALVVWAVMASWVMQGAKL